MTGKTFTTSPFNDNHFDTSNDLYVCVYMLVSMIRCIFVIDGTRGDDINESEQQLGLRPALLVIPLPAILVGYGFNYTFLAFRS